MRSTRPIGIALAAALALAAGTAFASPDPEKAKPCEQAASLALLGPSSDAADKFLACAQVPGQTAYKLAHSRFMRLQMLEAMDKRDLAEAELVALTSPPVSDFPVFSNSASGFVTFGGEQSIGFTQVDLLAARANYRLFAKDHAAALDLANRTIAKAGYDPATVFDTAPAFAVRARLSHAENNNEMLVKHAVRAYLRGSDDPLVLEVVRNQPPATQDQLKKLREHIKPPLGDYLHAITARARAMQKPEEVARAIHDGKEAAAGLQSFEAALLGPL